MAESLGREYLPDQGLGLSLAGWELQVLSNSPQLISELKDYFGPFVSLAGKGALSVTALEAPAQDTGLVFQVKQPDPGKSKIKEEWADLADGRVVKKRLTGMIFAFGGEHHLAVGPCLANSNQVINFINNRMIQLELNQGALLAHAAGVRRDGAGLALAGFSGMGKSTLALHLMSLGATFISNDRLLVRREDGGSVMTGVPKLPRINPGTALNNPDLASVIPPDERERFAEMTGDEIWDLEHKYDVDISECFGPDRFKLRGPLNALAILNWQRDGSNLDMQQVDLAARPDLLAAFKKDWGLFFLSEGREPDHSDRAYLQALAGVTVFELGGGVDFLGAAQRLYDALGEAA
ncbi:MAG: HprK-related kinase B [Desulfarculaceae bacterium]|nr:HprK-related kinase B [Desulfarculaceae bacterium]MCF8071536.1 HprK-related kinase B [Desulfarculaceae bacterium]MCF8102351.1 HprK-related kinase B [Desulfarculaceae bacterium]MCF8114815.1 HprK-related kinase B [Desulfarculaceae bacterium]